MTGPYSVGTATLPGLPPTKRADWLTSEGHATHYPVDRRTTSTYGTDAVNAVGWTSSADVKPDPAASCGRFFASTTRWPTQDAEQVTRNHAVASAGSASAFQPYTNSETRHHEWPKTAPKDTASAIAQDSFPSNLLTRAPPRLTEWAAPGISRSPFPRPTSATHWPSTTK